MTKMKYVLWLALAAMPLFTAGCPVDVNEAVPDDDGEPPMPECDPMTRVRVRVFHAGAGTKVIRDPQGFAPPVTPTLVVTRPDPVDAEEVVTLANLAAGRAALSSLCPGGPYKLTANLSSAKEGDPALATVDVSITAGQQPITIVAAGHFDPGAGADAPRLLVVNEAFGAGPEAQLMVVHASTRIGTAVVTTSSAENPPVTSTTEALDRYEVSAPIAIKATSDREPVAVTVAAKEGEAVKATYAIAPRFPAPAKGLAILFDLVVYDPDNKEPDTVPPPVRAMFLTGDDPLLGSVLGGGVTFAAPQP